jgi:cytochrome c oxidase assembly factor CtaG
MWQKMLALAVVPVLLILGGCGAAKKEAVPAAKPANTTTAATTSNPQGSLESLRARRYWWRISLTAAIPAS